MSASPRSPRTSVGYLPLSYAPMADTDQSTVCVSWPAMPSALRPLLAWKWRTAATTVSS